MPPLTQVSKDPRILRTRQLLREALVALLEEKDFEVITVQDIADRATVNRATVYAHYQDKYDLLADAIRASFQEVLGRRMETGRVVDEETPLLVLLAVCDFLDELEEKCQDSSKNRLCEPFLEAQVKMVVRDLLLNGLKGEDREMRATLWSWGIYAAAWEWLYRGRPKPVNDFAESAILWVREGLGDVRQLLPGSGDTDRIGSKHL